MKPWILVRAAAVVTLLYFAGHMLGMPWTPARGPAVDPLLEAMKSTRFEALGSLRTYWEFYQGFGIVSGAFLLLQAVLLWQVGSLARADFARVRPIVAVFLASFLVNAALVWRYFFVVPLALALAAAVLLGLALLVRAS